jgi:hypothetical protein
MAEVVVDNEEECAKELSWKKRVVMEAC